MYVDEGGNADLQSSDNPNHRFLSLTGVIVELNYIRDILHPRFESLKNKYFHPHPDDPVIFHRTEMVNKINHFRVLEDRLINENFDKELLELLSQLDYTVITICIDKKRHRDVYTAWRYDPYHYCLMILLERYIFFLEQNNAKGDLMCESRGGNEDTKLKASYERLWDNGTDYITNDRFQNVLTSRQLKIKPKNNNISGLQLADILAHPSRKEILSENSKKIGELKTELAPFASKIIKVLQNKYYQKNGEIAGFGKKFL
jgi:hypothetical protein